MDKEDSPMLYKEVEKALGNLQNHQISKSEQTLNHVGGNINAVSDSYPYSIGQCAITSLDFLLLKEKANNFKQTSKVLVGVLEEVGKIYPFIQPAVAVFKAGIQLELTRRENDGRIITLYITMCDMMSTLKLLRKVQNSEIDKLGNPELSITAQLRSRMVEVVLCIKSCAELCHSYQKRHAAIKYFTSPKWKQRFTDIAEQFVAHQNAIQLELQMHLNIEIIKTNESLAILNKNVNIMMETVFEKMQTSREREIASFVTSKGYHAGSREDSLLEDVLRNQQPRRTVEDQKRMDEKAPAKRNQPDLPKNLDGFKKELNKYVDAVLEDNSETFRREFDAIEARLKEVKSTIIREGDRVIETILAGVGKGPHERIIDKDIYYIWQEMGWKGSVEATHLVMAIHDHFAAKSHVALNQIHAIAREKNSNSPQEDLRDIASIAERAIPTTPAGDLWCLQYINVQFAQPLIEALDENGSSFVTVNEANAFTTSCPEGWSLPRWIAYWAIGFELTTHWYYHRIRQLLALLSESSKGILPANRRVVTGFLKCWPLNALQILLSGLRYPGRWSGVDLGDSHFLKFKGWVVASEGRMEETLRRLVYNFDQDNTLEIVTGGGRPEKYMMPLFYLLLKRSCFIVERAHKDVLHNDELDVLRGSLLTVVNAVRERVSKLKAIYKLQNIKKEERLPRIFFGLYAHTFDNRETLYGEFWTQSVQFDLYKSTADEYELSNGLDDDPDLYYGPQAEDLPLAVHPISKSAYDLLLNYSTQEDSMHFLQNAQSMLGAWSGIDHQSSKITLRGAVSLTITQSQSGKYLKISGVDHMGPFSGNGHIRSGRLIFLQTYAHSKDETWRFEGLLNEDQDEILGEWGYPLNDELEQALSIDDEEQEGGGDQDEKGRDDGEDDGKSVINIGIELANPPEDLAGYLTDDNSSATESTLSTVVQHFQPVRSLILKHRPVEYAICCPSDTDFYLNKPLALWTLVRNTVNQAIASRHLAWKVIQERRDRRKVYLRLKQRLSNNGYKFDNPPDEEIYTKLVCETHPNDIYLWDSIAAFKRRREPNHTVLCDNCWEWPINSTRIVCMICSDGDTLDLCLHCQSKSVYRKKDKRDHKPTHPRVQFRQTPLTIETKAVLLHAQYCLEDLSDAIPKHCISSLCQNKSLTRPYWLCLECKEPTFLCVECNDHIGKERAWLLQRQPETSEAHHSFHTLALQPEMEVEKQPEISPQEHLSQHEATMKTRLDNQDKNIQAFETKMAITLQKQNENIRTFEEKMAVSFQKHEESMRSVSERLRTLEEMLGRVISAIAPATSQDVVRIQK
ncbi:hypothetical protein CPB83DRAFT_179823 [Crepidotus variabilis]|uniref:Uncharacterized protein n=1 Tax=Crepidotus variabilis TaxID=179855 RepID=A0A9P6EJT3_9AGAR|nr:hypothetical protein CPB83DRAFT_179823 [Crepidotus variabilis]